MKTNLPKTGGDLHPTIEADGSGLARRGRIAVADEPHAEVGLAHAEEQRGADWPGQVVHAPGLAGRWDQERAGAWWELHGLELVGEAQSLRFSLLAERRARAR